MDKAGGRGDQDTSLDAIASYGYTLTLMGRYDEAEEPFRRGQRHLTHVAPAIEARFILNHGYLRIFQERFDEADELFDQATIVLQQVPEPIRTRLMVNIDYDRAANSFRRGDIAAAQAGFGKTILGANAFGWQRLANYAQNYLADIAIEQGDYKEAEHLLSPGLDLAERNNERRRTASFKRSFADLNRKQGKFLEALDWAQQARDGYERLGAKSDIQKLDNLIQELRVQARG